ncbi:MAG: hypothetical protein KGL35_23185 [Bradyrhizobium sp.]|nr:hypothetical protein [Bradyrhizobium sp.]
MAERAFAIDGAGEDFDLHVAAAAFARLAASLGLLMLTHATGFASGKAALGRVIGEQAIRAAWSATAFFVAIAGGVPKAI